LAADPKVKSQIELWVAERELKVAQDLPKPALTVEPTPTPIAVAPIETAGKCSKVSKTITSYAWDNTDKSVTLYISLDGIENINPVTDVALETSGQRVTVKFSNVRTQNYALTLVLSAGVSSGFDYLLLRECLSPPHAHAHAHIFIL